MVRLLLEIGARTDEITYEGKWPLMEAAEAGHEDVVRVLLRAGAALDLSYAGGPTALCVACWEGHGRCAEMLARAKADVALAASTEHGLSPLHACCFNGYLPLLRMLLRLCGERALGALDSVLDDGSTPLYVACERGHLEGAPARRRASLRWQPAPHICPRLPKMATSAAHLPAPP